MEKREFTAKMFLRQAKATKVSAKAFLDAHREWLSTGNLAPLTSPILAKLDTKQLPAASTLTEIKNVVYAHMLASDLKRAELQVHKATKSAEQAGHVGDFVATVYGPDGTILLNDDEDSPAFEQPLITARPVAQRTRDWADRWLFRSPDGSYATIVHTKVFITKDNVTGPLTETVQRNDAVARILRAKRMATHKITSKKEAPLGWKPKVAGDHFYFSKG